MQSNLIKFKPVTPKQMATKSATRPQVRVPTTQTSVLSNYKGNMQQNRVSTLLQP